MSSQLFNWDADDNMIILGTAEILLWLGTRKEKLWSTSLLDYFTEYYAAFAEYNRSQVSDLKCNIWSEIFLN